MCVVSHEKFPNNSMTILEGQGLASHSFLELIPVVKILLLLPFHFIARVAFIYVLILGNELRYSFYERRS